MLNSIVYDSYINYILCTNYGLLTTTSQHLIWDMVYFTNGLRDFSAVYSIKIPLTEILDQVPQFLAIKLKRVSSFVLIEDSFID